LASHVFTYIDPPCEKDIAQACRVLESGGIIAYPTDVNWAVGCDASNVKAIDKIRSLKASENSDRPFSLICDSLSMASDFATIDGNHYRLLRKALPGPFTFLLKRSKNLARQINDKRKIVGIRIPKSPLVLELVEKFGRPLATSSLTSDPNSDLSAPTFGYQVEELFGHGMDMILDLGDEVLFRETSIIDLSDGEPELIRRGEGDLSIFGM